MVLITLGVKKQLDFQTLLIQTGKDSRIVKKGFIILIGLSALAILIRTYHNISTSIKIALAGISTLFTFVLIRASLFYHIDIYNKLDLTGSKVYPILELSSLIIIGIGSFKHITHTAIEK